MDLNYAHEKLYMAVRGLAVSPAPIQQRIADVLSTHLLGVIMHDALPAPFDAEGHAYEKAWDAQHDNPDGHILTWANTLSDDQASQVARWIVAAYDQVESLLEDHG